MPSGSLAGASTFAESWVCLAFHWHPVMSWRGPPNPLKWGPGGSCHAGRQTEKVMKVTVTARLQQSLATRATRGSVLECTTGCNKIGTATFDVLQQNWHSYIWCPTTELAQLHLMGYKRIGTATFDGCNKIGTATFDGCNKIGTATFDGCNKIGTATFDGCNKIGTATFDGCNKIGTATFDGCNKIGTATFDGCKRIAQLHCLCFTGR